MKNAHIHLLGVVGFDPLGDVRLRNALEREKPAVITVDVSEKLVDYMGGEWLSDQLRKLNSYEGLLPDVRCFIESQIRTIYRFPVTVSREYAQRKNIPIHYIGDCADLREVRHSINGPNRCTSAIINENETRVKKLRLVESQYKAFRQWFANPDVISQMWMYDFVQRFIPDDPQRCAIEANSLLELVGVTSEKIVHVAQLDLLTDDFRGQSLYERIRHLEPTRGTIADYDLVERMKGMLV